MHLPLHQILPEAPVSLYVQTIDPSGHAVISTGNGRDAPAGVHVHQILPRPAKRRSPLNFSGPVSLAVSHESSNLIWLITSGDGKGKGRAPQTQAEMPSETAPHSKVVLWDDKSESRVLELAYREPVLGLQCRSDKLVIVCKRRVIVFRLDFSPSTDRSQAVMHEAEFETFDNPLGLASIASDPNAYLLAIPGRQKGHVQLIRFRPLPTEPPNRSLRYAYDRPQDATRAPLQTLHIFVAHESSLRTITLSSTGALLITSSSKGTLLRVYDTATRQQLSELRRGTDQAHIWSVAVADPDRGTKIAASSDKGTIHVWFVGDLRNQHAEQRQRADVKPMGPEGRTDRPSSRGTTPFSVTSTGAKLLKPYLPTYFSSTWSDLTWRLPPTRPAAPSTAPLASAASGLASLAQAAAGSSINKNISPKQDDRLAKEDDVALCMFVAPSNIGSPRTPRSALTEDDLIVVTRSGAWYRLSTQAEEALLPEQEHTRSSASGIQPSFRARSSSSTSVRSHAATEGKADKHCTLLEYRRLGFPEDIGGSSLSDDEDQ